MKGTLLALLLLSCSMAHAEIVEWSVSQGGNGHLYEAVAAGQPITWWQADAAAQQAGGYLAAITSPAENEFVFSIIDDPDYWYAGYNLRGPWIGGYQPPGAAEPDQGWSWVTGEPFEYANWDENQPNEFNGSGEDYIHYGNQPFRTASWNDVQGDFNQITAYVVEYVPEPTTLVLLGLGVLVIRPRTASTQPG
jgi:hypothetical protein